MSATLVWRRNDGWRLWPREPMSQGPCGGPCNAQRCPLHSQYHPIGAPDRGSSVCAMSVATGQVAAGGSGRGWEPIYRPQRRTILSTCRISIK